jgi:hypothetical protein
VVTASHDKTIRLWDLRTGKTLSTLTYHKKAVRALAAHPTEAAFASGGADNIKKFRLPGGEFLFNTLQQQKVSDVGVQGRWGRVGWGTVEWSGVARSCAWCCGASVGPPPWAPRPAALCVPRPPAGPPVRLVPIPLADPPLLAALPPSSGRRRLSTAWL